MKLFLNNILDQYPKHKIYIGGDLNARIGNLNDRETYLFEETNLYTSRESRDTTINVKVSLTLAMLEKV